MDVNVVPCLKIKLINLKIVIYKNLRGNRCGSKIINLGAEL